MNDSSAKTLETISDPATLSRTLREAMSLLQEISLSTLSGLPSSAPLKLSLSRVELRLAFLALHLCPSHLSFRDWQTIWNRSQVLKRHLIQHGGQVLNL